LSPEASSRGAVPVFNVDGDAVVIVDNPVPRPVEIVSNESRQRMAATLDAPTLNSLGWNDQAGLASFARGGSAIDQLANERRAEQTANARKYGQKLY
jgi:hypothetical protein